MSDDARAKTRTPPPPPKASERARDSARPTPPLPGYEVPPAVARSATKVRTQPGLQAEPAVVTVAASGEPSVTTEMFWVEVEGHLPAGFDVFTRPGHGLEVVVEQRAYRKAYTGTGSLKTGLVPIAPIGTRGRLIARDTTTGETVERPWTWQVLRRSGGLWALVKRLLWKGD